MNKETIMYHARDYAYESLGKRIMVTYDGVKFFCQNPKKTTREIVGVYENASPDDIAEDMTETLRLNNYSMREKT